MMSYDIYIVHIQLRPPYNFKLKYPTACSTFPSGHLIGLTNITYPKLNARFSRPQTCS